MNFKNIKLTEWQQLKNIDIDFHDRLTIITGANASGKTTILNILARHFNWNVVSLATPKKDKITNIWKWLTGIFNENEELKENIGEIIYSNDIKANLHKPQQSDAQYNVEIKNQQVVKCFFIPSHRSVFRYQQVTQIPTTSTVNKQQAFEKVSSSTRNRYFGGNDASSSFHIKETLIAWNLFGRGNPEMEANDILLSYYKGFQEVLEKVLPKTLGFVKFEIRNFEVILICKSGNFIIDGSSGGISALIDIAWQIYMYSTEEKTGFTVMIDEIENHLHPTMQRQILPDLLRAFPEASFIISTHSPLVIGSVQNSNVYVLKYDTDNKVISEKLDLVNQAKTATEILDEVLGVSFTMPVWAEEKLKGIVDIYSKKDMTQGDFSQMRDDLKKIGLERLLPEAISNIIEIKND